MDIKIEHKVSHREWDEAHLTPEQFIKFDDLYHSKIDGDDGLNERHNLSPTFVFDNGSVYVDENWDMNEEGRVSTSSYQCGVMSFSDSKGQYIGCVYGREKELGQLITVKFTVEGYMLDAIKQINGAID